jgi:PleD family two-component response regulator
MSSPELILVVDDTPANLEVVCETLSDAGYFVATGINGDRALKKVQAYPADLILLFKCQELTKNFLMVQAPDLSVESIQNRKSKILKPLHLSVGSI